MTGLGETVSSILPNLDDCNCGQIVNVPSPPLDTATNKLCICNMLEDTAFTTAFSEKETILSLLDQLPPPETLKL